MVSIRAPSSGGALGRGGRSSDSSLGNPNVQQIVDVFDTQVAPRDIKWKREHAHRAAWLRKIGPLVL